MIVQIVIIILAFALFIYVVLYRLIFCRNPEVQVPRQKNSIVSPAYGKVGRIIKLGKKEDAIGIDKGVLGRISIMTKDVPDAGWLVQIILNVHDVHYQKAPIDGKVRSVKHAAGKFVNAVKDARSLRCIENERNEVIVKGTITVKVVQLAGVLARRVHCFVKPGENVKKGQDIGIIKLGSQVLCILPKNIKIKVKERQNIKGGETILGVTP